MATRPGALLASAKTLQERDLINDMVAEDPIAVLEAVDYSQGAKFLADAGMDGAGEPALRK